MSEASSVDKANNKTYQDGTYLGYNDAREIIIYTTKNNLSAIDGIISFNEHLRKMLLGCEKPNMELHKVVGLYRATEHLRAYLCGTPIEGSPIGHLALDRIFVDLIGEKPYI